MTGKATPPALFVKNFKTALLTFKKQNREEKKSLQPAHVCHRVHLQLSKPHIPVLDGSCLQFICEMQF